MRGFGRRLNGGRSIVLSSLFKNGYFSSERYYFELPLFFMHSRGGAFGCSSKFVGVKGGEHSTSVQG